MNLRALFNLPLFYLQRLLPAFACAWCAAAFMPVGSAAAAPFTAVSFTNPALVPDSPLVEASPGTFYTTTTLGGANSAGAVLQVGSDGSVTSVFDFSGDDYCAPSGLITGADGNYYGCLSDGGSGYGAIFQFVAPTTVNIVYRFSTPDPETQRNADGCSPSFLTAGIDGNLYGLAPAGPNGDGVVFKVSLSGTISVDPVYAFVRDDHSDSLQRIIQGTDGNLYGCSYYSPDEGVIVRITLAGQETVLHQFEQSDPFILPANLLRGSDGGLYGVTLGDGGGLGSGDFFRLTTDGTAAGTSMTELLDYVPLSGHVSNGGPVISSTGGKFYGVGLIQPATGTVYQLTTDGTESGTTGTNLHEFPPNTEGAFPDGESIAGIVQGQDGNIYGTTTSGGANGLGTFFKIDLSLPALPAIASFAVNGPSTPGAVIHFTATTASGVSVRVQSSLTPTVEGSWTDLPGGGAMKPAADGTDYTLDATNYPLVNSLYFRVITAKTGFRDSPSAPVGTFDLRPPFTLAAHGPTAPGGSIHFTATTAPGFAVRLQATTTPDVEGSWTDVPYPNGGYFTEQPKNSGNYVLDASSYPGGTGISFRAIASKKDQSDFTSGPLGTFDLQQAILTITPAIFSTSDPATGAIARLGDKVTFEFTVHNQGTVAARNLSVSAVLPTFHTNSDPKNALHQFLRSDVVLFSPGYSFHPATSSTANDARVVWSHGTLLPNDSFTVSYTVLLSGAPDLRIKPTGGLAVIPGSYEVSSATSQPMAVAGTDALSIIVATPLRVSLNVTPGSIAVTPGGMITYQLTVANLSRTTQKPVVAVLNDPPNTRFAGVQMEGQKTTAFSKHSFYQNGDKAQTVITLASLAPVGDSRGRDSVTFDITYQAQWVDPAANSLITAVEYLAAVLNHGPANASPILEAASAFLEAGTTPATAGPVDFSTFLKNPAFAEVVEENDSGDVNVSLVGNLTAAPVLAGTIAITDDPSTKFDDINTIVQGDNPLNTVTAGGEITLAILVNNAGESAAEEVAIEEPLPENTTLVKVVGNAARILSSASSLAQLTAAVKLTQSADDQKLSHPQVSLDPDGLLHIAGLHLEPHHAAIANFTVALAQGDQAPAIGEILHIEAPTFGSASLPGTSLGTPGDTPVIVVGAESFGLTISPLLRTPTVAPDEKAAADTLTAIYNQDMNALPLVPNAPPGATPRYVPGEQRYYIHYENTGAGAVSGVALTFPLPTNTAFYRASFSSKGELVPYRKGNTIVPAPTGASIVAPPFLSGNTSVEFDFERLASGASGEVMVEVIVLGTAVQPGGSFITADDVVISDGHPKAGAALAPGLRPQFGSHQQRATFTTTQVADATHIPKIGFVKYAPYSVAPGQPFDITYQIVNFGDFACDPRLCFVVPAGTTLLSYTYGGVKTAVGVFKTGDILLEEVATNNGPILQGSLSNLLPHTSGCLTVTLQAAASGVALVNDDQTFVNTDYAGNLVGQSAWILDPARARAEQRPLGGALHEPHEPGFRADRRLPAHPDARREHHRLRRRQYRLFGRWQSCLQRRGDDRRLGRRQCHSAFRPRRDCSANRRLPSRLAAPNRLLRGGQSGQRPQRGGRQPDRRGRLLPDLQRQSRGGDRQSLVAHFPGWRRHRGLGGRQHPFPQRQQPRV